MFHAPGGGNLRYGAFRARVWRPTLARLGLPPLPLHALRHSAASRMIQAGGTPTAVARVLGHASAGFTLPVYWHAFAADLDDLAARIDAPIGPRLAQGVSRIGQKP